MENRQSESRIEEEDIESLGDGNSESWGNYPIDEMLIRPENRTVHDIMRRIEQKAYIMKPDFQRDFIWDEDKQSRLIESVVMRIPLPVFYLAEDEQGRMIVVDGLQRLSTFRRFVNDKLRLKLADRKGLDGKRFSDLPARLQNRVEDCNLILYIIDSKVPEQARLDIFERVNGGVPLTRQQMRNCLHNGPGTRFLKKAANSQLFKKVTGGSLRTETMRDREFINRFCAFQLLTLDDYRGDMDEFLAKCLKRMNKMEHPERKQLADEFMRGLTNNFTLFGKHAFRKHTPDQGWRARINASLWDVMSTGLSHYSEEQVIDYAEPLKNTFYELLADEEFNAAITLGTSDSRRVKCRFDLCHRALEEILDD